MTLDEYLGKDYWDIVLRRWRDICPPRLADMYSVRAMDPPAWRICEDTYDPADYEKTIAIKETPDMKKTPATSYNFLAKPNDVDFDRIMAECGTEMAIVVINHEPMFVLVANSTLDRFNVTSEARLCGAYLCPVWGRDSYEAIETREAVRWKLFDASTPRMRTCRAVPVNNGHDILALTVSQIQDQWERAQKKIDLYKFTVVI